MLKKIALLLLVGILVFLAGCSNSTTSPAPNTTPTTRVVTATALTTTTKTTTATATTTITSTTTSVAKEPVSIKVGSLPRIYDIIAFVAKQENLYEKYGVKAEIVSFRSETEKDNAMLAGQLDGVIEGTFGAINLNKNEQTCQLVGHNFMTRMFELVVSSTSGITDASQLKGKDIATSTGTIMEYALDRLLASKGVDSKDVNMVNVSNMPLRLEMLTQGKVAAALFTSPLSDQAAASGNIILISDNQEQFGGPGLIFSLAALKAKPEGIAGFISAWQEAVRLINADPEKYRDLIVSAAKVPESLTATYKIPVFPELKIPEKSNYDKINSWMVGHGMITQPVPYEKAINTSFIK
jgi:NitT/TauT family transport system substrate-binding protein